MSVNKIPFDLPAGDELLDPSFIAHVASRLYNEVPGVSGIPGNVDDAAASLPEASDSGAILNNNASFNEVTPDTFSFLHNILGLEAGENNINSVIKPVNPKDDNTAKLPSGSTLDYYFLRETNVSEDKPLLKHTDNLVSQQTLQGDTSGASNLKQYVQKVQSVSGGFYDKTDRNSIFDVNQIRKDFPVLNQYVHGKPIVWLDNAATTQKPKSVIDALTRFYSIDNSNIHRGAHTLAARATDDYEGTRENVRRFIGAASSDEIIFVRGTTEAINLVAQTWGRQNILPGEEILVTILEHHANIVPWQMLAREKGAILKPVPVNDKGEILLEEYSRLLNPRTKLVAIAHASNSLGTILPVREMIQLAKRYDTKVLVDGAQSVAHIPVNVQEFDADFFVFSGHKIFAPTGIGVLYGKKEILENMPPWQGGGNMISDVTFEETVYNVVPNKFEAGTPSVADAIGLGAALDYVNRIGLHNIAQYEHKLTEYATEKLRPIPGLRLIGSPKEKVGVISFVLNGINSEQAGRYLDQEGIALRTGHHCAQPALRRFGVESTIRPSLAFYNTFDEIDRLVLAVKRLKQNIF